MRGPLVISHVPRWVPRSGKTVPPRDSAAFRYLSRPKGPLPLGDTPGGRAERAKSGTGVEPGAPPCGGRGDCGRALTFPAPPSPSRTRRFSGLISTEHHPMPGIWLPYRVVPSVTGANPESSERMGSRVTDAQSPWDRSLPVERRARAGAKAGGARSQGPGQARLREALRPSVPTDQLGLFL